MLEVKIEVNAPGLVAALNNLAAALALGKASAAGDTITFTQPAPAPTPVPVLIPNNPVSSTPAPQPPAMTAPVGPAYAAPAYAAPAPIQPPINTPPMPRPATTPPAYSLDSIARAGTSLVDAGKMQHLLDLLKKYGVQALTQIDPAQYGAFATELRALGAQI